MRYVGILALAICCILLILSPVYACVPMDSGLDSLDSDCGTCETCPSGPLPKSKNSEPFDNCFACNHSGGPQYQEVSISWQIYENTYNAEACDCSTVFEVGSGGKTWYCATVGDGYQLCVYGCGVQLKWSSTGTTTCKDEDGNVKVSCLAEWGMDGVVYVGTSDIVECD